MAEIDVNLSDTSFLFWLTQSYQFHTALSSRRKAISLGHVRKQEGFTSNKFTQQGFMDDDIRRDIAFALAKHIRSNRPADADEARVIAAANVLRYPRLRS